MSICVIAYNQICSHCRKKPLGNELDEPWNKSRESSASLRLSKDHRLACACHRLGESPLISQLFPLSHHVGLVSIGIVKIIYRFTINLLMPFDRLTMPCIALDVRSAVLVLLCLQTCPHRHSRAFLIGMWFIVWR